MKYDLQMFCVKSFLHFKDLIEQSSIKIVLGLTHCGVIGTVTYLALRQKAREIGVLVFQYQMHAIVLISQLLHFVYYQSR